MKKLLTLLCLLPIFALAQPGYINSIVGTTWGLSGDGGPATAAQMGSAFGVWVDGNGNIYIPDIDNLRIRKVNLAGIITTVAGGGHSLADGIAATSDSLILNNTGGITTDIYGNLYFSDGNRIRKVTVSTGIITTVAGSLTGGYTGDGGPATAATLSNPIGLCFDGSGNLYACDYYNNCIRKINTAGIISTIAGTGSATYGGDGGPATAADIQPQGICTDPAGNFYIADGVNYRVRKIDVSGVISTIAGTGYYGYTGDGGPATAAQVHEASGICRDNFGNLYIADFHNNVVRKISTIGIMSTFAGGGSSTSGGVPATSMNFNGLLGVGIDPYSNVYLGDLSRFRIYKVNGVGMPTVTRDSFSVYVNSLCAGPNISILPVHYSPSLTVKTLFGDGTNQTDTFSAYAGYSMFSHIYAFSGTYTVKHVLYIGSAAVDSVRYNFNYTKCTSVPIGLYYDANSNCSKDSNENFIAHASDIEVDSNGIAVDTISCTSGLYYNAYGAPGDVYQYKLISPPAGLTLECPASGVITDTIAVSTYSAAPRYFAFSCDTAHTFDLGILSSGKEQECMHKRAIFMPAIHFVHLQMLLLRCTTVRNLTIIRRHPHPHQLLRHL